ncbi:hypothetical protein SMa0590 (plasmid) [Sinorhizobium meliloti 1021]|uniref:Uncharacterized protein n=1 Tax=Rhizobium meliloti (strain 1021) TaxID=266834 RepID=Q92ZZ0_RHIME|nr:hypothetical protein SMa0590 [Sinorhizobium meliloti 1021]AGG69997.1 Hypothetical protein SM2011_a0590 [Sinorhizobium meliloti 2011]
MICGPYHDSVRFAANCAAGCLSYLSDTRGRFGRLPGEAGAQFVARHVVSPAREGGTDDGRGGSGYHAPTPNPRILASQTQAQDQSDHRQERTDSLSRHRSRQSGRQRAAFALTGAPHPSMARRRGRRAPTAAMRAVKTYPRPRPGVCAIWPS